MKLKIIIPRHPELVQQFGQAKLVKLNTGQHELIGGSDTDRTAAFEWTSLFAHEIVFTHFHRPAKPTCSRKHPHFPRLRPV
jgi:hypothetical protein